MTKETIADGGVHDMTGATLSCADSWSRDRICIRIHIHIRSASVFHALRCDGCSFGGDDTHRKISQPSSGLVITLKFACVYINRVENIESNDRGSENKRESKL